MKEIFCGATAHIIPLPKEVDATKLATLTSEELAEVMHRGLKEEDGWVFKVNPDLIVRQIGDEWMLVPTGEFAQHFNGMISLNVFSHFVWQQFEEPNTLGAVLRAAHDEFDDPNHMLDIQVRHLVQEYVQMGLFKIIMN